MKLAIFIFILLVLFLAVSGTAGAAWPSGSQGDQYAAVNAAMTAAVAGVGMSPSTFISIYNAASSGNRASLSGFSDPQLAAACQVMKNLTSYKPVLADYDTVYRTLGCDTRTWSEGPSGSSLPNTGIAVLLMVGSGVVGVGAATRMLRKSHH